MAERWYGDSALEDLLGVPVEKINDARLYRGLDVLLEHKDADLATRNLIGTAMFAAWWSSFSRFGVIHGVIYAATPSESLPLRAIQEIGPDVYDHLFQTLARWLSAERVAPTT